MILIGINKVQTRLDSAVGKVFFLSRHPGTVDHILRHTPDTPLTGVLILHAPIDHLRLAHLPFPFVAFLAANKLKG